MMTRATTFPFKWLSAEAEPEERYTDAASRRRYSEAVTRGKIA
ncbi:MAG: hypothetical protein ACYTXE_40005 [Nostoc sp.]